MAGEVNVLQDYYFSFISAVLSVEDSPPFENFQSAPTSFSGLTPFSSFALSGIQSKYCNVDLGCLAPPQKDQPLLFPFYL